MPLPHSRRLFACLALAAPALASAASIDVTATGSAQLTGLSITSFDLNPGDGVAAGYGFVINPEAPGGMGATYAGTTVGASLSRDWDPAFDQGDYQTAGTAFAPLQISLNASQSNAAVSSQATGIQASATAQRTITDNATPEPFGGFRLYDNASAGGIVDASGYETSPDGLTTERVGYLEVAAYTAVEITGVAQISGAAYYSINDCDTCVFESNGQVNAVVRMQLAVGEEGDVNWEIHNSELQNYAAYSSFAGGTLPATGFDQTGTLRLTYANTTGTTQRVRFWVDTNVSSSFGANVQGLPTPEPGTYVLMGIGLGAAGWIARRRRVA